MTRANVKTESVRALVGWWRSQGWTPEMAHAVTRYWPEGTFEPDHDLMFCWRAECHNQFLFDPLVPLRKYCSLACKKRQNRILENERKRDSRVAA